MTNPWKELFGAVQTPGDWAVVLIFGTVGFAGDLAANVSGIPSPAVIAGLSASGALGLKKGAQSWWATRRKQKALKAAPRLANELKRLFEEKGFTKGAQDIQKALDLHGQKSIDNSKLDEACQAAVAAYLAWDGTGRPPPDGRSRIAGDDGF